MIASSKVLFFQKHTSTFIAETSLRTIFFCKLFVFPHVFCKLSVASVRELQPRPNSHLPARDAPKEQNKTRTNLHPQSLCELRTGTNLPKRGLELDDYVTAWGSHISRLPSAFLHPSSPPRRLAKTMEENDGKHDIYDCELRHDSKLAKQKRRPDLPRVWCFSRLQFLCPFQITPLELAPRSAAQCRRPHGQLVPCCPPSGLQPQSLYRSSKRHCRQRNLIFGLISISKQMQHKAFCCCVFFFFRSRCTQLFSCSQKGGRRRRIADTKDFGNNLLVIAVFHMISARNLDKW